MKSTFLCLIFLSCFLLACRSIKPAFQADKQYEPAVLQADFDILIGALEAHHPGLFWYQTKEVWGQRVKTTRSALDQPLSEPAFRKILRPLISSIRCGHTSVRSSKQWQRYADTMRIRSLFPLSIKCWPDTMLVLGALDPKDSIFKRGTQIVSINGRTPKEIYEGLFPYIFGDGFNESHKFQTLSGWGTFGSYYQAYLDSSAVFQIDYLDSLGDRRSATRRLFTPKRDTTKRQMGPVLTKKQRKFRRLENIRSLQIDTAEKRALMRINSFAQGGRLRQFFRKGFSLLNDNNVIDLIIDVRNNGGGEVGNSTTLSRYLFNRSFKIADSLYAVRKYSPYTKYIKKKSPVQPLMPILTRKRKSGLYHFGYFERHRFSPKRKNHYAGRVYILTGGNSFSATTLFVNAVRGQKNVTVIGEETGGGAYGNSAWAIPEINLPNTGVRTRLPLFRMVMGKDIPNDGRGIMPDIPVVPTVESVQKNYDNKLQRTMILIQENRRKGS